MSHNKTVDCLNSLIIYNNDRIEGYKTAEAEAKETDLKMMFSNFRQTSLNNRLELEAEVLDLGGIPEDGTKLTGKFFRAWMDVKVAFSNNDRKTILDSCEFGEKVALEAYKKVLIENHRNLGDKQQVILNKQYGLLAADYSKIAALCDVVSAL